jgi:poly(A) polymerase
MATRFGLTIEPGTRTAVRAAAPLITAVSAERIADEMRKMLPHPNRSVGVWLLSELGLIEPIFPELTQNRERWWRTISVVSALGSVPVTFPLALAALLCDLGRQEAEAIADRLRLSNAEKTRVAWLVEMRDSLVHAPTIQRSRLNPILVHPGINELLALHEAVVSSVSFPSTAGRGFEDVLFCEQVLRDTPREELDPPPLLTGNDLKALGMKPGPEFKRLLDAVREAQLDGELRTRDDALARVRELSPGSG